MPDRRVEALMGLLHLQGQEHVLRFVDELGEEARRRLVEQLESVDFGLLARLVRGDAGAAGPPSLADLEDPAVATLPSTPEEESRRAAAREAGLAALRSGRVAALVVAGGQGSRLGFEGPKGCFPVGPVTARTLFRIHAEKVLAASRRARRPIPWYVMTSHANERETREYLRREGYFGLDPADVFIFRQGMLPAVDSDGKLVLEEKDRVFMAPDGHGGTLKALHASGALDDMTKRGIEAVSYFQVDNPLVPAVDPVFIGLHLDARADMSSKVLRKRSPDEPIGTVVRRQGKDLVLEYSDIPPEVRDARAPDGSARFPWGSIAIHVLSVAFVRRFVGGAHELPFHAARKKMPFVGPDGARVRPEAPNGIKFETFVFDALRFAERTVTMEVRREDEFAPVKNAAGEDSVETARRAMVEVYGRWLEAAGVAVERDQDGRVAGAVEVSPLTADSAEELRGKVPSGTVFRDGLVL